MTATLPEPAKRYPATHIRWAIRRDMDDILAIENAVFPLPWGEEDFIRCLRQRNSIGMVAERDQFTAGFMIYELHKSRLQLLNFAVHPNHARQGVGTALVNKLIGKLQPQRRSRILLEVRETNLAAQMFFSAQGFQATSVLRNFYDEPDANEDAYLFEYCIHSQTPLPKCSQDSNLPA